MTENTHTAAPRRSMAEIGTKAGNTVAAQSAMRRLIADPQQKVVSPQKYLEDL
jgi:hypothetical protein